jgi:hypothetical protein
MTGLVWVSIIAGLLLVVLAVGIPYLLTHKGMRAPHDLSEGQHYIRTKHRWMRRRRAAAGQPQRAVSEQSSPRPRSD